ncbi:HNH endonuclease [Cupriavidus plantarum]|uniref:HNH endonuclease n=1 Tax=Cupriavidus plantarum TaxID=942865 RepID=UPI00142DB146|nr:HNH endonuclease [Cupriavidus plantarum]
MDELLGRDGGMAFYWVNVGATFPEVKAKSYLWAPTSDKTRRASWDNVADVKKGDVIFCYHDKEITHIAVAKEDAFLADRPDVKAFSKWAESGYQVNVELDKLDVPISRDDITSDFMSLFNERCVPSLFKKNGEVNLIYMASLPADAGTYLLERAHRIEKFEARLVDQQPSKRKLTDTEKEAIRKARVGQGRFRTDLIRKWNGKCSLTGLSNTGLLIASHIHAWTLSDNDERIDPDNGLLLAPHIDKLFDRGLISFADDGQMLISATLEPSDREVLSLDKFSKLSGMTDKHRGYMARHRRRHGFAQS